MSDTALVLTKEECEVPMVPSVEVTCRDCRAECWCSKRLHARLPEGAEFSCQACLTKRLKEEEGS